MVVGSEEVVFEARLDHPPADEALKADEGGDAAETEGHGLGDSAAGDEVGGGEDEGETDEAAPDTVYPFHPVNGFKFFDTHTGVELLEFGRLSVLVEFGLPVKVIHWRERAGDRFPFCDTETVPTLATFRT